MKILNGAELRDFIKERQAKQVRSLRQSWRVIPKLVIFRAGNSEVVDTYVRLKKKYGEDILIDIEERNVSAENLAELLAESSKDDEISGIIVQLPIMKADNSKLDDAETGEILSKIIAEKDVDGLNNGDFDSATAVAINWLLAGYNVELKNKKIAIVGNGRLVGQPLAKMWRESGHEITIFDEETSGKLEADLKDFDIIISAAGVPDLIKSEMLKNGAVIIDAGTSSEGGEIKGDVSDGARQRKDISITPKKGGIGPLTIAALMENVIISSRKVADKKGQQDL